jgi:adenine-specific DNA methylase
MTTPYSNIFERFADAIQDYELDALYLSSTPNYESYLLGFLRKATVKFKKCAHDLTDRDDTTHIFTATLNEEEEEILSTFMIVEWFNKEANRLLDIRMGLSETDFKRFSEAQNIREKTARLRQLKIDADKLLIDYTYDKADLTTLG